jgi:hypothetical protein
MERDHDFNRFSSFNIQNDSVRRRKLICTYCEIIIWNC